MEASNLLLFILQIVVCFLLVLCVLLQTTDEDSLVGMGANAGKPNVLSKILSIDPVTKITIGLGILLMLNSLILANMSSRKYKKENSSRVEDYIKNVEKSEDNEKESDRETINNLIEQKGLVGDEEKKESAESSQQGNK